MLRHKLLICVCFVSVRDSMSGEMLLCSSKRTMSTTVECIPLTLSVVRVMSVLFRFVGIHLLGVRFCVLYWVY